MIDIELVVQEIDKKIAAHEELQHFIEFKYEHPSIFSINKSTNFESLENETKENGSDKRAMKVRKWLNQDPVEERSKRTRFKNKRYNESQFVMKMPAKTETVEVTSSSESEVSSYSGEGKKEASKEFFCSICNKFLSGPYSLARHMQIHTGYKPHECHICHHKFIQVSLIEELRKKRFFTI